MKKEIFEGLKTKFPGVQDAILDRIATKLAKTVTKEEEVATLVEGVTFQNVLESYGDHRANESQITAVTNYEKKHSLKDGAKVQAEPGAGADPEPGVKGGIQTQTQDSELAKTVKGLQEKIEKLEGEKSTEGRLQRFTKTIEKAPDKIRDRYNKDFKRLTFKDDAEFDEWLTEVGSDIEAIATDYSSKGGGFQPPKGNKTPTPEQASPEVKARIESRKAETGAPAIQGLPQQKV